MDCNAETITINTDHLDSPEPKEEMWENRAAAYSVYNAPGVPKCSIAVTAYNRLEKTKYCVECILKFTQDVDFELILVDNGSSDGTYEFFRSIQHEKKKVIKITKNMGVGYAWSAARSEFSGKYLVFVPNDVYVTKSWLSNLITCYESDSRIGLVLPVSSNVTNYQQVDFIYKDLDEMHEKAAEYNKSDPLKWEERMRVMPVISVFSRLALDIVGVYDAAYVHDFADDDLSIRFRRSGFKLMLCRDTWVCHDHDHQNMEDEDKNKNRQSLDYGRSTFNEKFYGIDAWDDISDIEFALLESLENIPLPEKSLQYLVVDGRCGTPVLEIRNKLRQRSKTDIESYSFTTKAKYYLDLQTVADDVQCDRIDFIQSYYGDCTFDFVALCEPINVYPTPITLLQRLYNFLKPGGIFSFKLRNTNDFNAFLRSVGIVSAGDADMPAVLTANEVTECLTLFGGENISVIREVENLSKADQDTLKSMLKKVNANASNNDFSRLFTKNYVFSVTKG